MGQILVDVPFDSIVGRAAGLATGDRARVGDCRAIFMAPAVINSTLAYDAARLQDVHKD